jgi:hypothetical protein
MYQRMSVEPMQESGTAGLRFVIGNSAALLDVNEIDSLIAQLGRIRAHMLPAPPPQPEQHRSYSLEVDPCWHVDRSPLVDGVVLLLRHAGFGWVALTAQPPMHFGMSPVAN